MEKKWVFLQKYSFLKNGSKNFAQNLLVKDNNLTNCCQKRNFHFYWLVSEIWRKTKVMPEKYRFSQFHCTPHLQLNIPATKIWDEMLTRMNGFHTKTILFLYNIKGKIVIYLSLVLFTLIWNGCFKNCCHLKMPVFG